MKSVFRNSLSLAAVGFVFSLSLSAAAQPFPSRTITLVVPFAAGGGTDSIARDMAKLMQEKLGQPVIVENKGGAGGALGADAVAKAKAEVLSR